MAIVEIPVSSENPHSFFTTTLSNVTYGFEFIWNARAEAWFFSLYDVEEEPIVSGRKVVVSTPLLETFRWDARIPSGTLYALDTSGQDLDPGEKDLGPGARVKILYDDGAEE